MVTGDHHGAYARLLAFFDGGGYLLTGRINKPYHAGQRQLFLYLLRRKWLGQLVAVAVAIGQHPQAFAGPGVSLRQQAVGFSGIGQPAGQRLGGAFGNE